MDAEWILIVFILCTFGCVPIGIICMALVNIVTIIKRPHNYVEIKKETAKEILQILYEYEDEVLGIDNLVIKEIEAKYKIEGKDNKC